MPSEYVQPKTAGPYHGKKGAQAPAYPQMVTIYNRATGEPWTTRESRASEAVAGGYWQRTPVEQAVDAPPAAQVPTDSAPPALDTPPVETPGDGESTKSVEAVVEVAPSAPPAAQVPNESQSDTPAPEVRRRRR